MSTPRFPNTNIPSERYKDTCCIADSCDNNGIHSLRILYFNKTGRFCTTHKNEFLQLGIIEFDSQATNE
ncbi:MAG: hypothetical protein H0W19_04500 [Nitrosopumilus sp.]|nr:hypothetical protein [Nitrosopumilus sp.]